MVKEVWIERSIEILELSKQDPSQQERSQAVGGPKQTAGGTYHQITSNSAAASLTLLISHPLYIKFTYSSKLINV